MKNKRFEKLLAFFLVFALVFPLFAVVEPSLAAGTPVMKTFDQLTEEEKGLVLTSLVSDRVVPARVTVDGGSYPLNESLWYEKGIIAYGNIASVNSNHQTGSSPNYKNGQYRYWGYDMNGGLYGNDDFPRDSDSGTPAYQKAWLTLQQIRNNSTASGYVGSFALTDRFTTSQKRATAEAFLDENPQWEASGKDVDYLEGLFMPMEEIISWQTQVESTQPLLRTWFPSKRKRVLTKWSLPLRMM